MEPTQEQLDAVDLFSAGMGLAIEAGAGTGKTTTLVQLARSTDRIGQYVAFNRAIVDDSARKMPSNVSAATAHSLAMRAVGRNYRHRLGAARMRGEQLARVLGVQPMVVTYGSQRKVLAPGFLASHAMRAIRTFCQTADDAPNMLHVPYIDGIDAPTSDGRRGWTNNNLVRDQLASILPRVWSDLCDRDGQLPYTHDHYLKLWERSDPKVHADFILFDEAQDAAPVMLSIVEQQIDAQRVFVGDSCQPTGTMVDVVIGRDRRGGIAEPRPIEAVRAGDTVVAYDVSGSVVHRMGRRVEGVSSRWFAGNLVAAKVGARQSRYTPDHHCVAKIGDALADRHLVYVMRRGTSYRVGRAAARYGTAFGPMIRAQAERADALWVLSDHATAEDAATAEALASARFGLPMMLFEAANNRLMSQRGCDDFWLAMGDLTLNAAAALTSHGRDVRWPLWEAGSDRLLIRRARTMRACNLMSGMYLRDVDAGWVAAVVDRERYEGLVWSMTVEGLHTYIGDGIVTHNCQQIYGWRGAVNALQSVPADARTFLTRSFRFGPAIADMANLVLDRLGAELRLEGTDMVASRVDVLSNPAAILCRTNAEAITQVLTAQAEGRTAHLVGGAADVASFARAAKDLQEGRAVWHPELACFTSWGEVVEYVQNDPQGDELALLVKLVESFGCATILRALDNVTPEAAAQVTVSTAHKSKGREWSSVQLASDFDVPDDGEPSVDEWRLLYVALTRARETLDVRFCAPLLKLVEERDPAPSTPAPIVDDIVSTDTP